MSASGVRIEERYPRFGARRACPPPTGYVLEDTQSARQGRR
jgi:hypothetical protein